MKSQDFVWEETLPARLGLPRPPHLLIPPPAAAGQSEGDRRTGSARAS